MSLRKTKLASQDRIENLSLARKGGQIKQRKVVKIMKNIKECAEWCVAVAGVFCIMWNLVVGFIITCRLLTTGSI